MMKIFCGLIKEGEDAEFKIGDEIVADELENWQGNKSQIHLRYTTSDYPIDQDLVDELVFQTIFGVLDAEHGCVPFSEWTGFVAWDDSLVVGNHDLLDELMAYEGKYCYLELWQDADLVKNETR